MVAAALAAALDPMVFCAAAGAKRAMGRTVHGIKKDTRRMGIRKKVRVWMVVEDDETQREEISRS